MVCNDVFLFCLVNTRIPIPMPNWWGSKNEPPAHVEGIPTTKNYITTAVLASAGPTTTMSNITSLSTRTVNGSSYQTTTTPTSTSSNSFTTSPSESNESTATNSSSQDSSLKVSMAKQPPNDVQFFEATHSRATTTSAVANKTTASNSLGADNVVLTTEVDRIHHTGGQLYK